MTIRVEDAQGAFDVQTYTLNVNEAAPAEILGGVYSDPDGGGLPGAVFVLHVPGTTDPWLAGMPDGTTDYASTSATTIAPDQSPIEFVGLPLVPGTQLSLTASGIAATTAGAVDGAPADGERYSVDNYSFTSHHRACAYGIADVFAPLGSLVGVFLGPDQPDATPAPDTLDFRDSGNVPGGIDYLTLDPQLQQVFFIGDGRTRDGQVQQIRVPAGATRLFLGVMEGTGLSDNQGGFDVALRGTEGWTVYLDQNDNGVRDPDEQFTVTDRDGRYRLGGLIPDQYRVAEEGQPGWAPTRPTDGFDTITVAAGDSITRDLINTQTGVPADPAPASVYQHTLN